ncbi:Kelch-like protein 13 [Larimichthys crocea]|uniref:Uncharacterized protein n=1 Tax=Larimichthys crocea TaxID=215358 RepID=A0ACD3R389_LARCR|nr:Kelch-like protein 13 [Larimichthys crocea]
MGPARPGPALATVECYNPRTNEWTYVAKMNEPHYGHAGTVYGGYMYISVQFCVGPSHRIRSGSAAVLLSCLRESCQPDEPDRLTQPSDHHSSSGVAEFRHKS